MLVRWLSLGVVLMMHMTVYTVVQVVANRVRKTINTKEELDEMHKKIVNRLAAVSNHNPDLFPLLDELAQIHATTSDFFTREHSMQDQVSHKDAKIRSLQQDVEALQRTQHEELKKQTDQITVLQGTIKQHEQTIKLLEAKIAGFQKQVAEAQAALAKQTTTPQPEGFLEKPLEGTENKVQEG